jgi:hypothetical protein
MSADDAGIGEEPEYEEKLDEKPKSILLSMIRQLKTGMDLSKVSTCAWYRDRVIPGYELAAGAELSAPDLGSIRSG